MIITYFRSSSYNCHDMCNMAYFNEYVLGWRGPANIKADKGTIVHKVLEVMALAKKAKQEGKKAIEDNICGLIPVVGYDINTIVEKVFAYYSKSTDHNWSEKDFKDCKNWTWKALQWNDGQFDPRRQEIVDAEPHFDVEITEPWAIYNYKIDDKELSGFLRLKGTIDLITKVDDNTYEICDWKSGRRLNWATGEEKTHAKLRNDPQLRLYHYAAHKLYNVNQILVTIFYINDGGPFTVCFEQKDLNITLDMIKNKFETIKNDLKPMKNRSWKCSKLCHQGKSTFKGTHIKPIVECRDRQVCDKGEIMTKCEQVALEIERKGIDRVTAEYAAPGHDIAFYKNPGEI